MSQPTSADAATDLARRPPASADAVLVALDPEQREVATALRGPVCVLAGAGTGKTRALTHRIAYGVHSGVYTPQHVLAVTFTARAAGELRTRLRDLGVVGVQARTFHSAALRQLHFFWPRAVGGAAPDVMAHKASLVAEAGSRLRLQLDRAAVRDLASEVEWAKVSLLSAETYPDAARRAGRDPAGLDATAMARLLQVYEDVKGERGVIDFEDVLLVTAGVLQDNPHMLDTVRQQYRHFVVDEYQDVSPLQQRLLDLWLGERDDLCVVGDASQTIYSFTGASPRYLLGFRRRHPSAQVVKLVRDYRSTPQVVALANGVLAGAQVRPEARLQLVAQRPAGPTPTFTEYDDDVTEAVGVADRVKALVQQGVRASEIAVLFRMNAQSEQLEQALAEAGIAYLVKGGERFFARREVREAVLLLRGAARSGEPGQPLGQSARDVLGSVGWSAQPPSASGAVRERWESLQALAGLADTLEAAQPGASLADLVRELDERAAAQHAPTVEGVSLASLHAAKGLEWDAVFLVGVSEGLLPISMAQGLDQVEEERRLLYVGVTRAREHLHLSWARARQPGGRATRKPSRFLDGLRPSASAGPAATTRARDRSARQAPATCRGCSVLLTTGAERKVGRCNACPPTYDETTFEALRTWRLEVATAASLPAYVVFTDATLVALAERRPADLAALAAIPGIGATKRERYGAQVLAVLAGDDPVHAAMASAPHDRA